LISLNWFRPTQRCAQWKRALQSDKRYSQTVRLNARRFPWHTYILASLCCPASVVWVRDNMVIEGLVEREKSWERRKEHAHWEETRFIRYKPAAVGFRTTSYAFPDTACICTHTYTRTQTQSIIVCQSYVWRNVSSISSLVDRCSYRLNSAWRRFYNIR